MFARTPRAEACAIMPPPQIVLAAPKPLRSCVQLCMQHQWVSFARSADVSDLRREYANVRFGEPFNKMLFLNDIYRTGLRPEQSLASISEWLS